jgi:SAM-dependent methyltransferase
MQKHTDTTSPDFWIDEWDRFQKDQKIGHPFRRSGFWNQKAKNYASEKSAASDRMQRVLAHLKRENILKPGMDILDIGSGPGTFAIPFIEHYCRVTCIDVSSEMLDQIDDQPENLTKIVTSWRDLDLAAEHYENRFDLVFAHMTPAINCSNELFKMMYASKRWCFLAGWAGDRENQPMDDLHYQLVGHKRQSRHFHFALNLLYTLKIYPSLWFQDHEWTKTEPLADAIEYYTDFFSHVIPLSKQKLHDNISWLLQKRAQDGMITKTHKGTLGSMLWSIQGTTFDPMKHIDQIKTEP